MGTKTISILDEAYDALAREKGDHESFSDVILKLTGRRGKLADSLGKWRDISNKEMEEIEKELDRVWKNWGRGHTWKF